MDIWKNFPRPPCGMARVKKNLYPSLENSGGSFCREIHEHSSSTLTHTSHTRDAWLTCLWSQLSLSSSCFWKHTDRLLFFLHMSPIVRQSPLYTAEALTNLFFHWTDMHFNTFGCNNRRCHPCSLFWKIKGHDVILSFVSFYSLNDLNIIIKHGQ